LTFADFHVMTRQLLGHRCSAARKVTSGLSSQWSMISTCGFSGSGDDVAVANLRTLVLGLDFEVVRPNGCWKLYQFRHSNFLHRFYLLHARHCHRQ